MTRDLHGPRLGTGGKDEPRIETWSERVDNNTVAFIAFAEGTRFGGYYCTTVFVLFDLPPPPASPPWEAITAWWAQQRHGYAAARERLLERIRENGGCLHYVRRAHTDAHA